MRPYTPRTNTQGGNDYTRTEPQAWPRVVAALLGVLIVAAALLLVFGLLPLGGASKPAVRLAFASNRGGNFEIYTAAIVNLEALQDADEGGHKQAGARANQAALPPALTDITRLTNDHATAVYPAWSPDGRKIAYSSDRDGKSNIYVVNADGSGQTALTHDSGGNRRPVWSPDGKRIAFESDRHGTWDIWAMNADGSGQTLYTTSASEEKNATWSPDGKYLAYDSWATGNTQIYVMTAEGTNPARLTVNYREDWAPAWSPDGEKIAFATNREGPTSIYMMNADGSGQVPLSTGDLYGVDEDPAWSADGRYVIFASKATTDPDPRSGLFLVSAIRPLQMVQLSSSFWIDRDPALSPATPLTGK